MRDQYAGDVSDMVKFAFLRVLAGVDRRLGVAWYYAPGHDGRPDGRHLEWRDEIAWRGLDPELFDHLATLPERSIAALEQAPIWPPGALCHRVPMPRPSLRDEWGAKMRAGLEEANLVFLDPDNGLGTNPEKHATFDEVRQFRKSGRTIVFITFPGRVKHDLQVRLLHQKLRLETGAETIFTLCSHVSVRSDKNPKLFLPRFRWFTVIDSDATLLAKSDNFAKALSAIPRAGARIVDVTADQQ